MAAGTIKLTNGSTTVTGSSTTFTSDLKVNDFISVTVGGTTYTLGVSAIASNTSLTVNKAYQGATTSGLAYQPIPFNTLSMITTQIAADTARMTRQYNLDKDNWYKLLTQNTASTTINLADGSSYTGPSWLYLDDLVGTANTRIDATNTRIDATNNQVSQVSGIASSAIPNSTQSLNASSTQTLWDQTYFSNHAIFTLAGAYVDMPDSITTTTGLIVSWKRRYSAGAALCQTMYLQGGVAYQRVGSLSSDGLTVSWYGSTTNGWRRIYDDSVKPTAAEIGALPTTGGTMSSTLNMNGSSITNNGAMSWSTNANIRSTLSNLGFSQPSTAVFDIPGGARTMRIISTSTVVSLNVAKESTISFPSTFPSTVMSVICCPGDNIQEGQPSVINFSNSRTSSFDIHVNGSVASASYRVNYIAIGY